MLKSETNNFLTSERTSGNTDMKPSFIATLIFLFALPHALGQEENQTDKASALPEGATLLFEDDFNRNESQEEKDEPGNGWTTNSAKRAAGNKQVDLIDGAMHIVMHPVADHGVSVVHDAPFENGLIKLRFLLPEKSSSLGLDFADPKYKPVHAGHLCKVVFKTHQVEIADLKTGIFDKKIRAARLEKKLTDAQKEMLKTKSKKFKHKLPAKTWHSATIRIEGEKISVSVNDKPIGEFSSAGIDHPTKRIMRLAVPKQATVDDIIVYSLAK